MAPKKSIIRKGTVVLGESKGPGERDFVSLKDGDAVNLAPLVNMDELISVDQHAIWLDGGNSPMFPCIGDGCPGCKLGNQPRFRAFLPVVVLPDNEVKIFSFGIRVARALEELDSEFGGLKGHVFKVKRKGVGLSTNYTVISMGKTIDVDGFAMPDVEGKLGPITKEGINDLLMETGATEAGKEEVAEEVPSPKVAKGGAAVKPAGKDDDWDEV